ncbi:secondary thiamine-phosphate synthase enzyme YjbQ [Geobacter argillaceus]|uniref:Secondary thiamine-phosphate synthase enzyme n=1 Tax=Geobacter argillaceus TaxID=345631 RepID=A0A562WTD8_9BACT|nr:secondary thiamine-phosphate synthase enzyme YjbQ [Geobacter argillaceus]TWJ33086.1 secondary thiamine-phosphate synthase enzyme [Geobacter argillaceus]
MVRYIEVKSRNRTEMIDITAEVREVIKASGVKNGLCQLFVLHTTAGITVNEGADPAVQRDIITFLNQRVPVDLYYTHREGNSDAHIKATLTGSSLSLIVDGGKPLLGTWQSVFFCEFDGPRPRKVAVTVVQEV